MLPFALRINLFLKKSKLTNKDTYRAVIFQEGYLTDFSDNTYLTIQKGPKHQNEETLLKRNMHERMYIEQIQHTEQY